MLIFNGTPLRVPDSLAIAYQPPEGATPATKCLMEVEAGWDTLTAEEAKNALRPVLGQGTLTIVDPATMAERSLPVMVVRAQAKRTREGYQQVLTLREVAGG